jgi:CheY-like chemotaxis protein
MDIRALMIDDCVATRKAAMRALVESGLAAFAFTEASGGGEGLLKFDPHATDLVFVNWNLPGATATDLVRRVRNLTRRHVPIVMVATENTPAKVEEALDDAGVDAYISTPFPAETLRRKLAPLLAAMAVPETGGGFLARLAARIT